MTKEIKFEYNNVDGTHLVSFKLIGYQNGKVQLLEYGKTSDKSKLDAFTRAFDFAKDLMSVEYKSL